jgi:hypothetical protein
MVIARSGRVTSLMWIVSRSRSCGIDYVASALDARSMREAQSEVLGHGLSLMVV